MVEFDKVVVKNVSIFVYDGFVNVMFKWLFKKIVNIGFVVINDSE